MAESILQHFIAQKNSSFVPALRSGIQSPAKYKAALMFALLTITPTKIGEKLNIPVQRVRTWHNQPAVVRQIRQFQQEFAQIVIDILVLKRMGLYPDNSYEEFADRQLYSESVKALIHERVKAIGNSELTGLVIALFGTSTVRRQQDKYNIINQLAYAKEILSSTQSHKLSQKEWDNLRCVAQRAVTHIILS